MRKFEGLWFRGAMVAVCLLAALLAGCSRDPNVRKQKFLESGERYYDKGQYREAAIQFQNAIQVDARFAEAHYRMGLTALKLEQWPGALQELTTATQINPDLYPARLELAKLLILGHEFTAAKEQLDFLTQNQPNNPEVYLVLANYQNVAAESSAARSQQFRGLSGNGCSPVARTTMGRRRSQHEEGG